MKVGDLIETKKGNLCLITGIDTIRFYVNVVFVKTGVVRTGLHMGAILRVVK